MRHPGKKKKRDLTANCINAIIKSSPLGDPKRHLKQFSNQTAKYIQSRKRKPGVHKISYYFHLFIYFKFIDIRVPITLMNFASEALKLAI